MPPPKLPEDVEKQPTGKPETKFNWKFAIGYFVVMLLMMSLWQELFAHGLVQTIPYSEFKKHLANKEILECSLKEEEITGKIKMKNGGKDHPEAKPLNEKASDHKWNEFLFRTIRVEDPKLTEELLAADVKFSGARPSIATQFLLSWVLPLGIMLLLWMFLSNRVSTAGESILNIRRSKARLVVDQKTGVRFTDVAGCDEAKYELQEVVDFLKNPQRYEALGAKIPKGALLVGPPGTGKTLLARAVAGEAEVPFYSINGSDFVEMFVGVGAARVRDLFQEAKKRAPCIIFIDEIDTIGRQRGVHVGVVNDEREQTLNQLLVELDGFETNVGVIVLAATNRPDVLDPALLRPGRFDRQVVVDSPDVNGREAILKVHLRGKPVASKVELRRVAQVTPGFSGADLANVANEAALLAARRNGNEVEQVDLEEAVEKVVAGPERKSRRLTETQKKRVAYHEVGHALVAAYSKDADPVHKISIVPRGRAALGYTLQLPMDEQFLMTREELMDRIRGLLGGRAAEEVFVGEVSTGAENDLERATILARQMVCMFGMSEKVGLAHVAQRQDPVYMMNPYSKLQRDCSEETATEIDHEVSKLLSDAHEYAIQVLEKHRKEMEKVVIELLKKETMDGKMFYEMIGIPQKTSRGEAVFENVDSAS
jgi:cell division protease FtsH